MENEGPSHYFNEENEAREFVEKLRPPDGRPGDRVQGDNLPVVVSVGSTSSAPSGAPLAAIR